jgi:hypothetical protein
MAAVPQIASGDHSTIAGGLANRTTAIYTTVGGGFTNFARADSATIGGGFVNKAEELGSTVAGGSFNTVILNTVGATGYAQYSKIPGGFGAKAHSYGQHVHASGTEYFDGDTDAASLSQASEYIFKGRILNNVLAILTLNGSTTPGTAKASAYIPPFSTWAFEVLVSCRNITTPTIGHVKRICGVVARAGAATTYTIAQNLECNLASGGGTATDVVITVATTPGSPGNPTGLVILANHSVFPTQNWFVTAVVKTSEITRGF